MIIQRLSAALRRQDWAQVTLEILIVVIGILIALQVDNWNEQRKAREQGEVWRQQIIADLDMNAHDLKVRKEYNQQALAFGMRALAGLEAEQRPTGDAIWGIVLGAFQAGQIRPYRLTGPTFREVQSAGGLALVGDKQAQGALAYLYDVSAYDFELVSGGLPMYRQMIRERLPWAIQDHIWDGDCEVSAGPGNDEDSRLADCAPPADLALVEQALDQLRADEELQRALRGRLSQLKVSVASTGRLLDRVSQARARLE